MVDSVHRWEGIFTNMLSPQEDTTDIAKTVTTDKRSSVRRGAALPSAAGRESISRHREVSCGEFPRQPHLRCDPMRHSYPAQSHVSHVSPRISALSDNRRRAKKQEAKATEAFPDPRVGTPPSRIYDTGQHRMHRHARFANGDVATARSLRGVAEMGGGRGMVVWDLIKTRG